MAVAAPHVRAIFDGREMVQDLELAAAELLISGNVLRRNARHWHAVYLHGYTVECTLKVATLRLAGLRPTDVAYTAFAAQHKRVRSVYPLTPKQPNYHDLGFWLTALRLRRRERGIPFGREFDNRLRQQVRLVARWWKVDMRYAQVPIPGEVSLAVYHAATFVRQNRTLLRS